MQINESLLKHNVVVSQLKSSEAEVTRLKAQLEENARQLSLAEQLTQSALEDKRVFAAESNATKQDLLMLHDKYETVQSELREAKVMIATPRRPMWLLLLNHLVSVRAFVCRLNCQLWSSAGVRLNEPFNERKVRW